MWTKITWHTSYYYRPTSHIKMLPLIEFLASRTAWHHNVVCLSIRPSVSPFVTLCIVALRVGVDGYKLYRRVPSRQLSVNFFRQHLCRRLYILATRRSEKKQTAKIISQTNTVK